MFTGHFRGATTSLTRWNWWHFPSFAQSGSLTTRFVIGAVLVASLPLVITGYIIDQNNGRAVRRTVETSHRSALDLADRAIANSAESIFADLQHLSSEPVLRDDDSDQKEISNAIDRYYENVNLPFSGGSFPQDQGPGRFEELAVFRIEGDAAWTEASANSRFSGEWATSNWLKKAATGIVAYSPPHFSIDNKVLVASIAVPVFSESGDVIRVLGAQVRLSRLISLADLDGLSEREQIDLRLIDRFGNNIAGVRHELLLEKAESIPEQTADTALMDFMDDSVAVVGSERVVGEGTIWADERWSIRSVELASTAFSDLYRARRDLIIGFSLGFGLILALSLIVGRGVTRPLRMISRAITELGSGDYSARLKSHSSGELEALANSFNSMADSLQETHDDLIELDRAKSEFLSSLSHELKTPLAAMSGFVYVLKQNKRGNLVEQDLNHLEVIARNGKRLDSMIDDLLDLTRIENKKIQLNLGWFEIGELTRDISQSLEHLLSDRQNELAIQSTGSPIWIRGDSDRIAQILTNLISNASKYSDRGSSITVKSEFDHERLSISVADQGQGIKPEDIKRLFTLFYRTEDAANSSTQGTGIGLYVSKRIAELHGGDIVVQSRYGEGSTFTVNLPGATETEPTETGTPVVREYSSRLDDLDLENAS